MLRTRVRLGLSARVLGALAILRLPAAELSELLAAEAAANPFLLPAAPPAGPTAGGIDAEGLARPDPSWQQDLMLQLGRLALPPAVARAALLLVGELDSRGWLDVPLSEIAAREGLDLADLEAALAAVQSCDPPGVGARDLAECLALQLIDLGLSPAEARATVAELPRFARRDLPGLQRALGLSVEGVAARIELLRRLTPDPVGHRGAPPPAPRLPDLVLVRSLTGPDRVALAHEALPLPRLDAALAERARAEGFGADLLDRALTLLRAVESRGATLLRIGDWLVQRQAPALRDGPGALRPVSRAECAAALGLHPSTVGRAVQGKALLADGRLWPLERLFPGPAVRGDAAGPANAAVAHRLAMLIAAEPAGRPLSDAALAARLAAEGVDIARRTVAKYRDRLRIPPAHRRRTGRRTGG
jgi:RNA polymerase sigma-54 factor